MTLIKGMGFRIDETPPKTSEYSRIGFRTHNEINQGNDVEN